MKMTLKNSIREPEYRLPLMFSVHFLIPIGLFWYGWSVDKHFHWYSSWTCVWRIRMFPIFGSGVFSAGVLASCMPIVTYLIYAFQIYAASALAANTVLRSLMGALLPLMGPAMVSCVRACKADCSLRNWNWDGEIVRLHLLHLHLRRYHGWSIIMERWCGRDGPLCCRQFLGKRGILHS